jgi:hypothetical protein
MERPPTKRQLAYIRLLARRVGASLYLGNIKTLEEASRTIETLKHQRDAGRASESIEQRR